MARHRLSPALVIWDFDGTLGDSFGAIRAAADEALRANGLGPVDDAALREVIGLSLAASFERLVGNGSEAPPDLVASVIASYRESFNRLAGDRISLFPGIADLLAELGDAGVPLAIATSKGSRGIRRVIDHLGLEGTFRAVVADDDVTAGKPHPDMVLTACDRVGVEPGRAVVIGDTVFDIEMGRRAGVASTIGVTWGNHDVAQLTAAQPDHLVETVEQLRRLLV